MLTGLALLTLLASSPPGGPDLLLENATVYASADAKPQKLSIVARNGRIAFVGEAARARRLALRSRRVDLSGAFVFPGWADAHGHLLGLGKSLEVAQLRGLSIDAVLGLSKENGQGYVIVDVTPALMKADWYFVPDVRVRSDREMPGASLVCERGSAHLQSA